MDSSSLCLNSEYRSPIAYTHLSSPDFPLGNSIHCVVKYPIYIFPIPRMILWSICSYIHLHGPQQSHSPAARIWQPLLSILSLRLCEFRRENSDTIFLGSYFICLMFFKIAKSLTESSLYIPCLFNLPLVWYVRLWFVYYHSYSRVAHACLISSSSLHISSCWCLI